MLMACNGHIDGVQWTGRVHRLGPFFFFWLRLWAVGRNVELAEGLTAYGPVNGHGFGCWCCWIWLWAVNNNVELAEGLTALTFWNLLFAIYIYSSKHIYIFWGGGRRLRKNFYVQAII